MSSPQERPLRFDTAAIHAGSRKPRYEGALVLPIFQCTVYELDSSVDDSQRSYHDVLYPRLNNLPNQKVLGAKLASLEGGAAGTVAASGLAAISSALFEACGGGGHVLVQSGVYGGTHLLLTKTFESFGMEFDFFDAEDSASWEPLLRQETRAIFTESISNPLMDVADHEAVVSFARRHGLVAIIDNTFTSPVNFRPLALGYDVVVHSATKYLNGHSDIVAGAIVSSQERIQRIDALIGYLGNTLDAHACFLLDRGLKTLALRVRRQNENALAVATALAEWTGVSRVYYPGISPHRSHERAKRLFDGMGGMLSFELDGGAEAAVRAVKALSLITFGPSLGGVETLITRPVVSSHAGLSLAERQRLGISDGLLRLSVGIEDVDDLLDELRCAIAAARKG